jgi:hypothetical protein
LSKFAIGVAALFLSLQVFAADLAILQNGFSIRHERREVIGNVTRLYTGSGDSYVDIPSDQIEHFEKDLSIRPTASLAGTGTLPAVSLKDVIYSAGTKHRIDPDFISSVIHAESSFNPRAVSPKGAQGLMQLMPGTASQLGVQNPFDPNANVEGGTRYLRELLERYNFDAAKALAAYNAGPQRVEQYGGVPPYAETRAYVTRVIKDFNRKKLAERKASTLAKKTTNSATSSGVTAASTPAKKVTASATGSAVTTASARSAQSLQ